MSKPIVIIVGKLPPPFIGPAIATKIILDSSLKENFELIHLDTTINKSIDAFGKNGFKKIGKNISIYLKLFQLLRKHKIDIIQIPISQTTVGFIKDSLFILIAALFSVKILIQLRGANIKNWLNSSSTLTKSYVRFCLAKAKGVIVLGNNLKHLFEDYFTINQIFVVPNGCDIEIPLIKSPENQPKVQLLYFSNLLESKGIKEILEALLLLKNKGVSSFYLNAVGAWYDANFKEKCLAFVQENNLPVSFHQPKTKNEKWEFFSNADIFVFTPNQPEGHPWSIIEALAAKLPIISTNQGAIIESVIDGKNGYIVDNNSHKQIAEK
ncbi:MAG: glycosyltransferase family 4 protein, partial [Salibacteraceae bacterium]